QMRRLPERKMLRRLFARRAVSLEQVADIARVVAAFHGRAARARPSDPGGSATVRRNVAENDRQIAPFVGVTLTPEQEKAVRAFNDDFLRREQRLLDERKRDGWVRECHGDLRIDSV